MRHTLTIVLLIILNEVISGQSDYYTINFDNGKYLEKVFIDTISNSNNIWEIGSPDKAGFDSSYSSPNALCTDLNDHYPANDTSTFTITHIANEGFEFKCYVILDGWYRIDSDTLKDYGKLEFSPDNGATWINLVTDTIYSKKNCYEWWSEKPVFTGLKPEWKNFSVFLAPFGPEFDIKWGDTVKYKFTFISDSIQNNRDGWILDNLHFEDWLESGIHEYGFNSFESNAIPNPAKDIIKIEFENDSKLEHNINIFDNSGKLIYSVSSDNGLVEINISNFNEGLYYYKIISRKENKKSIGKFIKN